MENLQPNFFTSLSDEKEKNPNFFESVKLKQNDIEIEKQKNIKSSGHKKRKVDSIPNTQEKKWTINDWTNHLMKKQSSNEKKRQRELELISKQVPDEEIIIQEPPKKRRKTETPLNLKVNSMGVHHNEQFLGEESKTNIKEKVKVRKIKRKSKNIPGYLFWDVVKDHFSKFNEYNKVEKGESRMNVLLKNYASSEHNSTIKEKTLFVFMNHERLHYGNYNHTLVRYPSPMSLAKIGGKSIFKKMKEEKGIKFRTVEIKNRPSLRKPEREIKVFHKPKVIHKIAMKTSDKFYYKDEDYILQELLLFIQTHSPPYVLFLVTGNRGSNFINAIKGIIKMSKDIKIVLISPKGGTLFLYRNSATLFSNIYAENLETLFKKPKYIKQISIVDPETMKKRSKKFEKMPKKKPFKPKESIKEKSIDKTKEKNNLSKKEVQQEKKPVIIDLTMDSDEEFEEKADEFVKHKILNVFDKKEPKNEKKVKKEIQETNQIETSSAADMLKGFRLF